jgi:hypothetical protein
VVEVNAEVNYLETGLTAYQPVAATDEIRRFGGVTGRPDGTVVRRPRLCGAFEMMVGSRARTLD